MGFTGHRLRNMTLLGMTAGLAAFFGVALGGTLLSLPDSGTYPGCWYPSSHCLAQVQALLRGSMTSMPGDPRTVQLLTGGTLECCLRGTGAQLQVLNLMIDRFAYVLP